MVQIKTSSRQQGTPRRGTPLATNKNIFTPNTTSKKPTQFIIRKVQSLNSTRKLALLVFIVCICTSLSVIFITGNGHDGHFYSYYDRKFTSILDDTTTTPNSKNSNNNNIHNNLQNLPNKNDPLRKKAIANAIKQTEKWKQIKNADEMELDTLINDFQNELQKLKHEDDEKRKRIHEAEVQQANDAVGSNNYYLYYHDDKDFASTIIGLPSFETTATAIGGGGGSGSGSGSGSTANTATTGSGASAGSSGTSAGASGFGGGSTLVDTNDPIIFKRFVGSLRNTGYGGHIIIGLDTSNQAVSEELMSYLESQNVIVKNLLPVPCTFEFAKKNQKCYHPYSHIKREWSYFPLARDWLTSCDTCTGSVVLASIKDTIFQRNPFGKGMPIVQRLHLYELHPSVIGADTSAGVLLKACDNIDLDKINIALDYDHALTVFDKERLRILSVGTAIGTRDDIIDYLGAIHSVMREWMHRSQCHFKHSSSDGGMAIVNYLRLKKRLPYRTRIIPHRTGIVNNVGYEGRLSYEAHLHLWQFKGLTEEEAGRIPYEGGGVDDETKGWIDSEYMLTDKDGNFIDVFFQRSAVIYEYNAFGPPFISWFDKKLNLTSSFTTDIGTKVTDQFVPIDENGVNIGESSGDSKVMKAIDDVDDEIISEGIKQEVKNNNDDYYIKDEEVDKSSNATTSALKLRKVKNTTEVIAEQQTAVLNSTKKEDDNEQPMYYKDRTSDDNNSTQIENEMKDVGEQVEVKKSTQVVPVEETLIGEEDEKDVMEDDDQETIGEDSALSPIEQGKLREKRSDEHKNCV